MTLKTNLPSQILLFSGIMYIISGCGTAHENSEIKEDIKTPVTITYISNQPMSDTLWFNAISKYIRKNTIKATSAGIIENVDVNQGDQVDQGQTLFVLLTKEAAAYEKSTSSDTEMTFKGEIIIRASKSGVITSMNHQKGDYVQEGDELAALSEQNSLVFILNVPFELREYIKIKRICQIHLSDHQTIQGIIDRKLPVMDLQSQTENFIVYPDISEKLPENLLAKIFIIKYSVKQSPVLSKQAILSNETLTQFWVMKLINDSTAVKIPIKKGIETGNNVEILQPDFSKTDRIILTGNYGLPDTAKVIIK